MDCLHHACACYRYFTTASLIAFRCSSRSQSTCAFSISRTAFNDSDVVVVLVRAAARLITFIKVNLARIDTLSQKTHHYESNALKTCVLHNQEICPSSTKRAAWGSRPRRRYAVVWGQWSTQYKLASQPTRAASPVDSQPHSSHSLERQCSPPLPTVCPACSATSHGSVPPSCACGSRMRWWAPLAFLSQRGVHQGDRPK
jgi:hypothetical protein